MLLHKQTVYHLLFHLCSLKLTTVHILIKNQNSGVLTAPLKLINSVWTTPLIQCLPATRLTQKTLRIYVATARVTPPLTYLKHGGNKRLILKYVLTSSVPVCPSWVYTMHKLIYAHHAHFIPSSPV